MLGGIVEKKHKGQNKTKRIRDKHMQRDDGCGTVRLRWQFWLVL